MRPAIIHIRASHLQLLNLRFELTNPMLVGFCFAIGKVLPDSMIDNLLILKFQNTGRIIRTPGPGVIRPAGFVESPEYPTFPHQYITRLCFLVPGHP